MEAADTVDFETYRQAYLSPTGLVVQPNTDQVLH
jgi:hypothetical protein